MSKPTRTPEIGEMIRREREARGMSQTELGRLAGTTQQTVDKIEKGLIKNSSFLPTILPNVGIPLDVLVKAPAAKIERGEKPTSARTNSVLGDLPVHGAAEGGKGAIIVSAEPVDYVARPAPLLNVKDGYGVLIVESSMEPEFRPGDIALVHPHVPPTPGDTCIFYGEQPDGTVLAIIKQLRRSTADTWHVTQHNPPDDQPRDFPLSRAEWQTCHVTVGRYNKR